MHLFAPSHQISAKGKNCGSNGRPDICGPDTVWDFSWQTSFFFISTGRLCSGGETLPRPPLAEPRQSHQQHLWAPQPGEGGERHKGRPHCGPRWVRPSQSGQHLSNPLRIRTALIIWGVFFQCGRSHCRNVLRSDVSDSPAGGRRFGRCLPSGQADEPHETRNLWRHRKSSVSQYADDMLLFICSNTIVFPKEALAVSYTLPL